MQHMKIYERGIERLQHGDNALFIQKYYKDEHITSDEGIDIWLKSTIRHMQKSDFARAGLHHTVSAMSYDEIAQSDNVLHKITSWKVTLYEKS